MLLVLATLTTIIAFVSTTTLIQWVSCILSGGLLASLAVKSKKILLEFYLYGFFIHLFAFYWLPETLKVFGGFDTWLAGGIHLLFASTAALQWLLIAWLVKLGRGRLGPLFFPIVYGVTDLTFPQMFPWSFANPLIAFFPLSANAEIVGSKGVSFILLLLATMFVDATLFKSRRRLIVLGCTFGSTILCGLFLHYQTSKELKNAVSLKVGLIQGNISIEDKSDNRSFGRNLKVFQELSKESLNDGAELVIWPETTIEEWTPNLIHSLRESSFDPKKGMNFDLLYGLLTYEGRNKAELKRYNSAFLVDKEGVVQGKYAKRVLMPFGEFLPLESTFPWLRDFSPMTGAFQAGTSSEPLELQLSDKVVRVGVLICYEDLVPKLARESSNLGGNLLVNITNDSWYGDTAALYQHSLLASWRAIETRRSLVRSTNTGLTTIVSPQGNTIKQLENFKRGILVDSVPLLNIETIYSRFGDAVFAAFLALFSVGYGFNQIRKAKNP